MHKEIKQYLATIGRRGGQKSRRRLDSEQARAMVRVREARRAFKRFQASCFWSYDSKQQIGPNDISWVAEQLMKNGNREAWLLGAKLCR